jgi:hypothetical protein
VKVKTSIIVRLIVIWSIIKAKAILKLNDDDHFDKTIGTLIYQLATKTKSQIKNRYQFLLENICNKNLSSEIKLSGELE